MFAVRRIIRNTKQIGNYICTSSVLKCDEPSKKEPKVLQTKQEKKAEGGKTKEKYKTEPVKDILSPFRPQKKSKKKKKNVVEELVSTTEAVANELGGDKKRIQMDLLQQIQTLNVTTNKQRSQLRTDRSVDEMWEEEERGRWEGGRRWEDGGRGRWEEGGRGRWEEGGRGGWEEGGRGRWDSKKGPQRKFEGHTQPSLNIFQKSMMEKEDKVKLTIWEDLNTEEIAAYGKIAPRNYFDELIQWTNEGKLWKFPIDNEQDMDEEAAIDFTEHVFLEKHLKPWCPEKGPLKKFMNLVIIGLSKNPYITLDEKLAHIKWFEDYFERKRKLLQELGAMGPAKLGESEQKS